MNRRSEPVVLLATLSLFWGLNWPAMKLVLGEMPVWTFRALCLIAGAGTLLAIARLSGERLHVDRDRRLPLVGAALLNVTGWHLFSAYGIANLPASRGAIVAYTMPLWASVLAAIFLKEPFGPRRALALLVGLGGLSLLIVPEFDALMAAPLGIVSMMLAALSWGAGTVVARSFDWRMPTASFVGWQLAIGGVPVVIGAALIDPWPPAYAPSLWGALTLVYVLTLPMGFCHWAYFRVVALTSASIAALGTFAIPVIGVVSSALLLGERFGWHEAGALLGVTLALLVLAYPAKARPAPAIPVGSKP